jgi:hypothetical protein
MVYISRQSAARRNIYTIVIPLHDPSGSLNPHILTDASRTDGRGRSLNLLTPPTSSLDPSFDPSLESESDSGSPGTLAVWAASSKCREPETESKSGSSGWNATAPMASAGSPKVARHGIDDATISRPLVRGVHRPTAVRVVQQRRPRLPCVFSNIALAWFTTLNPQIIHHDLSEL